MGRASPLCPWDQIAPLRGADIVVIDPRRTETAQRTGARWVPIRPGTDGALALSMIAVMIDEDPSRGLHGQDRHPAWSLFTPPRWSHFSPPLTLKGIHVAHIIIDGAVDAPDTLGKMLGPDEFQELRETRGMDHDGLLLPAEIADTCYHISQQHRSAWTHEIDMRAFSDMPW